MKTWLVWILVVFMSATLWARTPGSGAAGGPAATSKKRPAKKAAKPDPEMKAMHDALEAQQQQIQQLRDQLAQRDSALQQMQQQLNTLQTTATQAQNTAQSAAGSSQQTAAALTDVKNSVAGLKTATDSTATTLQKDEKRVADLEQPAAIHYKGMTITPGGYMQLGGIYRSKNANSDTSDNYGTFPLNNTADSHMSEFRLSGRASRLSLRADATIHGLPTLGYVEADFLGAAPSANETQTNSFTPRLRLAFANVSLPGGWSIAGGQNWSLLQTTRRGINPLTEWLPIVIDNSYTPGFSYARQGSIRVTKSFGDKAWFGISAENPDTVSSTTCVSGATTGGTSLAASALTSCNSALTGGAIQGLANGPNTTSPNNGFANTLTGVTATTGTVSSTAVVTGVTSTVTGNPSTNVAPDLVAKFAIEPGWGHYEVKVISRFFRDRVYPNFGVGSSTAGADSKVTEGGGLGIGMILPVVKNKVDFVAQGLGGKGIGRFGTTGGPDVTIRPDGSLEPIKALQAITGIETHPTPKFDFYIYGGDEYYGRTAYRSATPLFGAATTATNVPVVVGYGSPFFSNSGCQFEGGSACAGNNRSVWAIQPSAWYRLYQGKEGSVQFGASYAYIYRQTWSGLNVVNGTNVLTSGPTFIQPKSIENIVMTSFRYYFP